MSNCTRGCDAISTIGIIKSDITIEIDIFNIRGSLIFNGSSIGIPVYISGNIGLASRAKPPIAGPKPIKRELENLLFHKTIISKI